VAFTPNLSDYDRFVIAFSGGKDSTACFLRLLELGVPIERIELWHHDIDGRENPHFRMDWPSTPDYCRKFAHAFGVRLYFSWKQGGFEGEMLKENARTRATSFEMPEGVREAGGDRGDIGTRRRFPQVSADLRVRWCSPYLKIDVGSKAITNQDRFLAGKTLFISGERAEESPGRARYAEFEPHRTDTRNSKVKRQRRWVDHWRPVHKWSTAQVWEIIERWRVVAHPAYFLGWGRLSCFMCIFGSPNQWASIREIASDRFEQTALYEEEFGCTINRTESVRQRAARGKPYRMNPWDIRQALAEEYIAPIILPDGADWQLPAGAFGENDGPC
jgi:3'-phosphoadenosine 5'-phosphosulfate sulfotransferase (PAPS reductase)/FAD synthetase